MASSVDKIREEDELGKAHEFLITSCPWYKHASEERSGTDPATHCKANSAGQGHVPVPDDRYASGLVAKFTPHTAEASTVVKPTVPPGGPGLFHVKGMHLPPYMEHLWFHLVKEYGKEKAYRVANGVVHKWAKGINPGGRREDGKQSHVHPDVQAAAQRNIAEWEADKARAHEQSAGHRVHATATVELAGAMNVGTVTSKEQQGYQAASSLAGKYSQYGLHQKPSQTVSPSPPLPPEVPVPAPKEVRALISTVPECVDPSLSAQTRQFLETAAVKLEKDDEQGALASLRSAQAALYSAHKADLRPFSAATYNSPGALSTTDARAAVPPAETASAKNEMFQGRERQLAWRTLSVAVATLIERLRKRYFHGRINGVLPNLRLTEEETVNPLDKVIELAGMSITTGQDVSFPTETDTSRETKLLQPKDNIAVSDFKAKQELAALPPLSKIAVEAHLNAARDKYRGGNRQAATESLARACHVAREAGAHHLVGELHRHKEAVSAEENRQHTAAEMEDQPSGPNNPQTVADTGNAKLTARLR